MRDENGHFTYNKINITGDSINGYKMGFTPSPYEMIHRQLSDMLAADVEGKIEAALVEMGWTPPSKKSPTPS